MTRPPGPRDRLITNAIAMVQERGVHATGLSDLLRRSSVARNSIYQHFPGGKTELMVAVTDAAGTHSASRIDELGESPNNPIPVVTGMIAYWIAELQRTDFGTGCPIAAASLAGPHEPEITAAAARAFTLLRERVSIALLNAGVAVESAQSLASFSVSAIGGALLQARALRSVAPLRDVEVELIRRLSSPTC